MIWIVLAVFAVLVVVSLAEDRHADKRLTNVEDALRAYRRLSEERWQLLQERHDAVIELIAQIAEAKAEVKGAPKQKRKRAT